MTVRVPWLSHGRRTTRTVLLLCLVLLIGAFQVVRSPAARAGEGEHAFVQTNLVSDLANMAPVQDSNLKNPWGIAHGPATPWWVSDNNAGVSTLYTGSGTPFPPGNALAPIIPAPGATSGGAPTGVVFNGVSTDFVVSDGTKSGSSLFIFATEDGTIVGWSPAVNRNQAFIAVDNSAVPDPADGAVYKGLAIGHAKGRQLLYAANFRAGTVDVFDGAFKQLHMPGAFVDRQIPAGYAPFGIQTLDGRVYVTYALQNATRHDDVSGPGHGFVDVFSQEGRLLKRLIKRGQLNSPWGLALAAPGFGDRVGELLVGNFGNGLINAYGARSGEFKGALSQLNGQPIQIDDLWGIAFGNGGLAGPTNTLFFAAGINDETDGLFGTITAANGKQD